MITAPAPVLCLHTIWHDLRVQREEAERYFIKAEKGEVARAKGEGEKAKECTAEGKSRRRGDEKPPWALNYGSGEGGGVVTGRRRASEARSVRCMCDVCAAHGDRAAVGVDVDVQGSGLREDETHFPLNASVECRAFVSKRILVGLRWHAEKAAVFLGFPMSL